MYYQFGVVCKGNMEERGLLVEDIIAARDKKPNGGFDDGKP